MPILRETLDLSADTPKSRHHENPPRFIIPPLHFQMSEPVSAPMTDGLLPIQEAWADITLRDAPLGLLYIASTITPVAGIGFPFLHSPAQSGKPYKASRERTEIRSPLPADRIGYTCATLNGLCYEPRERNILRC